MELADEAGRLLLAVRTAHAGDDQGELKAWGTGRSQDLLARRLGEQRPGDAVLSEEAADDRSRLTADRVWIVDPLDGTREFAEGRHDWAVHVALWAGGELVAGAVALPGARHGARHRTRRPVVPPGRGARRPGCGWRSAAPARRRWPSGWPRSWA